MCGEVSGGGVGEVCREALVGRCVRGVRGRCVGRCW